MTELEVREQRLRGHDPDVDLLSPVARQVVALLVTKLTAVASDVVSADDAQRIVEMFEGAVEADPDVPWP